MSLIKQRRVAFLEAQEAKAILSGEDQKFRPSLYKAFLFMHTATGIKSGSLNFQHSYKYRPLDDYLIGKEHWHRDKAILLERAGLTAFTDPHTVLKELEKKLYEQYQATNNNAITGKNPHLKFNENGSFRIATPALEEQENESLQQYFPERRNVPLTEVLGTVNRLPLMPAAALTQTPTSRYRLPASPIQFVPGHTNSRPCY